MTAVALAGALVYPEIVALNDAGGQVTFFGIPVVMASYTSSLVPIIVAVWFQSHLQRWLTQDSALSHPQLLSAVARAAHHGPPDPHHCRPR